MGERVFLVRHCTFPAHLMATRTIFSTIVVTLGSTVVRSSNASCSGFVKQVKAGMILFLFEYEKRELYGVYQACTDGAMNQSPNAFSSSKKKFPAQVRFKIIWYCEPLPEIEFRDAIEENYIAPYKFNFGLSKNQVRSLLWLFSSRKFRDGLPPKQTPQHHLNIALLTNDGVDRDVEDERHGYTDTIGSEFMMDNNNNLTITTDYPERFSRTVRRVVDCRSCTSFTEELVQKRENNKPSTLANCSANISGGVRRAVHDKRLLIGDIKHHERSVAHQDEPIISTGYSQNSLSVAGRSFTNDNGTEYVHKLDDGDRLFVRDKQPAGDVQRSLDDGWSMMNERIYDGDTHIDDNSFLRSESVGINCNAFTRYKVLSGKYPELPHTDFNHVMHSGNPVREVHKTMLHEARKSFMINAQYRKSSLPHHSLEPGISNFHGEISHDDSDDLGTSCYDPDAPALLCDDAMGLHYHQNSTHQSSNSNLLLDLSSEKLSFPSQGEPDMKGYPNVFPHFRCNDSSQAVTSRGREEPRNLSTGYPHGRERGTIKFDDIEGLSHPKFPLDIKPSDVGRHNRGATIDLPAYNTSHVRGSSLLDSVYPVIKLDKSHHIVSPIRGANSADVLLPSEINSLWQGFPLESRRLEHPKIHSTNQDSKVHEKSDFQPRKRGGVFSRLNFNSYITTDKVDAQTRDRSKINSMVDEVMKMLSEHYERAERTRNFDSAGGQNDFKLEKHHGSPTRTEPVHPMIQVERNMNDSETKVECENQLFKEVEIRNFKRRSEVRKICNVTAADGFGEGLQEVSMDKQRKRRKLVRLNFGERLTSLPSTSQISRDDSRNTETLVKCLEKEQQLPHVAGLLPELSPVVSEAEKEQQLPAAACSLPDVSPVVDEVEPSNCLGNLNSEMGMTGSDS
ncbi:hypothetical protein Nepgr_027883 [Nepenthes gracilis]|uniref:DCD domain-containing protein n=1 Tax=Nepenthes gracilis TaxID=150966 RepID=A0AAD3Y3E1_NEPGR|nr:hypothetical protein Nepgr_027883 [Nepenthes gracilis]